MAGTFPSNFGGLCFVEVLAAVVDGIVLDILIGGLVFDVNHDE
jgi:hypothetical protein